MKVLRSVRDILAALVILYTSEILGMMGVSLVRLLLRNTVAVYETGPGHAQKGMDARMQSRYFGNLGSDDDMSSGSDSGADGTLS